MKKSNLAALASGALFGAGLLISGMAKPSKVLGFLDFVGDWDPSLMFVMGGAIAVHFFFARRAVTKRPKPLFSTKIELPERTRLDGALLGGAVIFGVGWGLGGYCPGPALASLASFSTTTLTFVAAMVASTLAMRIVLRKKAS